jgi:hypothetical protein
MGVLGTFYFDHTPRALRLVRWSSRVVDPQPVKGMGPPASYTTSVDSNPTSSARRDGDDSALTRWDYIPARPRNKPPRTIAARAVSVGCLGTVARTATVPASPLIPRYSTD